MVEDEDDLRQITARVLTRAGYQVLAATGGAQAIHLAHTHPGPIHLLLTDVIMPKMMGNEVAAQVRQRRPDTPVEKPFTSRELLDRVHAVLHPASGTPTEQPSAPHPPPQQHSHAT
jgi:DNA-binding response OmpR family regulator